MPNIASAKRLPLLIEEYQESGQTLRDESPFKLTRDKFPLSGHMTIGEMRYKDDSRESSPLPLNYSASIKTLINQKIKNIQKQKNQAFDISFKNRQRSPSRQKLQKLNVTLTAAPSMRRLPIKE